MIRCITKAHSDYDEINMHMTILNMLKNAHVHNMYESSIYYTPDMPDPERAATVQKVEDSIEGWLDGGVFKDWINKSGHINRE